MNRRAATVLSLFAIGAAAAGAEPSADGVEFFEKRVRPVFAEHCYECHSAEAKKLRGKLRLDSRDGVFEGGESGAVVVPGKPEESALITAVRYHDKDLRMPPPKDDVARKLDDATIAALVEWVRIGAPMPMEVEGRGSKVEGRTQHWAFVPPRQPALPAVKDEEWVKTDIDRFILAKLEAAGLKPAPPADARTLIRRMTFDLTGLPPTAEEVEAFIRECEQDAGKRGRGETEIAASPRPRVPVSAAAALIDRLLASPHYGERAARHWLDLARYSDTKGYVYAREERFFVHAWVYRDWVVKAFNDDLPYDRFLLLQLAADQLVPAGSPDLAAMGFITGGRRFIGVTRDIVDDRIDVVTRGTMALTAACARCHDHKYDPIPTRDYYSLYGVFDSCDEKLVSLGADSTDAEYVKRAKKLADTMKKRRDEATARLRARVGDYLAAQLELGKYPEEGFDQILEPGDLIPASVRRWRDFLHRTKDTPDPIFAPWHALAKLPAEDFENKAATTLERLRSELHPLVAAAFSTAPKTMREAAERYGKLFAETHDEVLAKFLDDPRSPTTVPDTGIINNELYFPTSACEELWKLQGEVDRWMIDTPAAPPHALVLTEHEPERNPRVFIRGNPARQGAEVPRQFPAVVAGPERRPFQNGSGRLELAQAIASGRNPLTARVMVNRIWQEHFGAGLVRTPSDFGLRAEPPSHPELLDWLALKFIESGWSVKAMHRLIVSSAVYQQSAQPSAAHDADNRLLSHFNRQRLDFEELRDAILVASGGIDLATGGKPSDLFTSHRRSIYGLVDRQFLPGTFRAFDFANPDLHIAQRHATTVPQQALFLLNNPFVADRIKAFAARADIVSAATPEERVRRMVRVAFQRSPTESEIATALRFIASGEPASATPAQKPVPSAWSYGWGEYDASAHRVKTFNALPHFTGNAWQGGANWPDAKLGWAQLTADGGHPGDDLAHACVRRWTAARAGAVAIGGEIVHEPDAGDGIRAFVVSGRHGELKSATLRHSRADLSVPRVEVNAGDTIDFVVDIGGGLNSDQFLWAPTIAILETGTAAAWDAKKDFGGPTPKERELLTAWEQYAQGLLLANEFSFVD